MTDLLRTSTLETLGLGTVLGIFRNGRLPVRTRDLVDRVFGPANDRGALVISGANGIVGAGKTMQLGSRLQPFGIPIAAVDLPGAPDGLGAQIQGLIQAFGDKQASTILDNVVRLTYDGRKLPPGLRDLRPRFLLEAIPEVLEIKKSHYEAFRSSFPNIEIRSVTSGFPSSELGVGIAHPAFPHQINKVWETVEPEPSDITRLLWSLGLIPTPVSDHWSFVLDVLFCGITLAGLRYHRATNMPFWKIDKLVRRALGPNPFRAHDAIGAKGANFLTWSCLHHLGQHYGPLFDPTPDLVERKETGQDWYPLNHFRPLVNWTLEPGPEEDSFRTWILGPMIQMTSIMLQEKRAHTALMNAIGELCAQFRQGILALLRRLGPDESRRLVEAYHRFHPQAADSPFYPDTLEAMELAEWQQLYVNAETDGTVGIVTISRESYNWDVDGEMNQALDWLKAQGVDRVLVTGDFHLSTQMVGADTGEFFDALTDEDEGRRVSESWSRTARRLHDEFQLSVGFVEGKRCLGGFLELLAHCHYLVAAEESHLGMPEVTLPVIPGMEGCHWPFRKCSREHWPRLLAVLMDGKARSARETVGWLTDAVAPREEALALVWSLLTDGHHQVDKRPLEINALQDPATDLPPASTTGQEEVDLSRQAILETVIASLSVPLSEAAAVQAKHSAGFMVGKLCRRGVVGAAYQKTMKV